MVKSVVEKCVDENVGACMVWSETAVVLSISHIV